METARAQADLAVAQAEEDDAEQAFLEAEVMYKRRRAERTAKRKITALMRNRLSAVQVVRMFDI
jgi:hypothetical protein